MIMRLRVMDEVRKGSGTMTGSEGMAKTTTTSAPAGGRLYTLPDATGTTEFFGVLLAAATTDDVREPLRWTNMSLYRVTDGPSSGCYVLSVVGRSRVFHELGGACEKGVRTHVDDLDENAQPCRDCSPAMLDDGWPVEDNVAMETDWPRVYVCQDAKGVLNRLRDPKGTSVHSAGGVSGIGSRLLETAKKVDAQLLEASQAVRRL